MHRENPVFRCHEFDETLDCTDSTTSVLEREMTNHIDSFKYTTSDVSVGKEFDYFHESVTRHFVPAECKCSTRENFSGEVNGHQVGQLLVGRYSAKQHIWDRTEHDVKTKPDEDIVALLLESGSGKMQQAGRKLVMGVGDIMLFDGARPFRHEVIPDSIILVRMPRSLIRSHFSAVEKFVNMKIADGKSIQPLLSGLMREAYALTEETPLLARIHLANAFINAISVALEIQSASEVNESYEGRVLFEKALSIIDARIDDQALNVAEIASALHVSDRTLSRIFAREGTTPSQTLWNRRLQKSYRLLQENVALQVTQIAFQCGFSDLSHFSRSFKRVFGSAPSQILKQRKDEHGLCT
ncbi:transcriptional regulator, AraC family [Paraburkholderia phymatum STM815]|uniref:Transcriptional regulator, AraC family n=2 Tax=Paraburkholderia phymatum TaxID=148447 RepID=B2JSH9_PARP8|nr:transcriptional regulator, AraC family [Paraburkholderia phymatum STM815]